MVPAYGEMLGGISAVIAYDAAGSGLKYIVICGYSDCSEMKALLHHESIAKMLTVSG
jgi:carbonic anhydrase